MKTGIMGGTFDPVHAGHVALAEYFSQSLCLDKVLIIPSGTPPHKAFKRSVSDEDRLAMCRLAFDSEVFTVLDIEIKRKGKSYTVDTLEFLKAEHPASKLYLMMGADMLLSFEKWFRYKRILELAELCAVPRDGRTHTELEQYAEKLRGAGAKVHIADIVLPDISSTLIRERLSRQKSIEGLVPDKVKEYIKGNFLYRQ